MNGQIGTDYVETQQTLSKMNAELQNMSEQLKAIIQAVKAQDTWRGPDALKFKLAIMDYVSKIANTIGWMEKLDNTIASHSEELYSRSINDSNNRDILM